MRTYKLDRERSGKGISHDPVGERPRSPTNALLDLQRTVGNRAVSDLLKAGPGQVEGVSMPGEAQEIEADRVAQDIAERSENTQPIQAQTSKSSDTARRDTTASGGNAMDPVTRRTMESHFGHNFGDVRIHTDSRAAQSARSVDARAYTLGNDVVFAAGEYAPEKKEGKRLLAHELAHVVQQGASRPSGPTAKTLSKSPQNSAGTVLQRQPTPTSHPDAGAPAPAPATPVAPPQLTQVLYDQALGILTGLPGADKALVAILKQGKVGQTVSGVKVVISNPQPPTAGALPAQITFNLEIAAGTGQLPQGAAAQFVEDPKNQTTFKADPAKGAVVTRLLKILAKPAASVNDMAWSLLHEGMHMLLGIDRTVDFVAGSFPDVASGSTGTLKSFAQYQQAGKTSSKRAALVSALVTEINRVASPNTPPSTPAPPASSASPPPSGTGSTPATGGAASSSAAKGVAEDAIDEILEERFAFDQQLKQFPGSKTVGNSALADAYMFDQLAFGVGLKSWPPVPNRAALVALMTDLLDDVKLLLTPPAAPNPQSKPQVPSKKP